MSKTMKPMCVSCGDTFSRARKAIGYKLCMPCGDGDAKAKNKGRTVVNLHKSNAILITDMNDLKDLNPKYIRSAT